MKTKAAGLNAQVEFDETKVHFTRLSGGHWPSDAPQYFAYPIEKIQAIAVSAPSKQGGTFTLIVDQDRELVLPPPTIEYADYSIKEFDRLIAAIEDGLRRVGRTPIGFVPLPPIPRGAYTYQMPLPAAQPQPTAMPTAAAVVPRPGPDLAGQIAQLAGLRDANVLSPAEFQAAKARLLGMAAPEPTDAAG